MLYSTSHNSSQNQIFFSEYKESFPVRSFTGSITNKNLVREACKGADAVLHIASLVDSTLFPNEKALQEVNVKGKVLFLRKKKKTLLISVADPEFYVKRGGGLYIGLAWSK